MLIEHNELIEEWQEAIDLLAVLVNVPAVLIMHIDGPQISVLVASQSPGNPYTPGDSEHWEGSGLYCETVVRTRDRLKVPNALADQHWDANPDIKLNMISYLGFPLLLPDGSVFGTICLLDSQENHYSPVVESLLRQFKKLIEGSFKIIEDQQQLRQALREIRQLKSLLPICAYCKKIRDDDGYWQQVEHFISLHTDTRFSHGFCPDCLAKHYPEDETKNL